MSDLTPTTRPDPDDVLCVLGIGISKLHRTCGCACPAMAITEPTDGPTAYFLSTPSSPSGDRKLLDTQIIEERATL